eukprot:CCRYP_018637-RB/>CCRYP_018637-RB protein AED:0.20 eAED:0.20 QI:289/1/1/1/1/1/6/1235/735
MTTESPTSALPEADVPIANETEETMTDSKEVTDDSSDQGNTLSSDDDEAIYADADTKNDGVDSKEKNSEDGAHNEKSEQDAGAGNENDDAAVRDGNQGTITQDEDDDDDIEQELWDLKVVFSAVDISKPNPILCSTDDCGLVACSVWSSNLDPEKPWYTCLDCQAADFGGWPEPNELPIKVLTEEHRAFMLEKCTREENVQMPNFPSTKDKPTSDAPAEDTSANEVSPNNDVSVDPNEETWDLKIVFNAKDLTKPKKIICSTEDCPLVACSAWVSTHKPEEPWFTCLDCQRDDFGGFPDEEGELPIKFLTEENRKLILEKCTADSENAELPNLPTSASLLATSVGDTGKNAIAAITPPPGYNNAIANGQSNVVVGALSTKVPAKGNKSVTPIPHSGASKNPSKAPPSKEALAIHRKWQAEAEKHGGKDARIVVSKPAAKKLIFDMLHDSFRPMNITEIYQKLKAIVPSPILKACLDDMSDKFEGNPFECDSDDEVEKPAKKAKKDAGVSTDEYSGSLRLKEGRNVNNILYYVDHAKLQNNGNGLDPDKRNDLYADLEKSKCEQEALMKQLNGTASETARLLSEPLNEELARLLLEQEKEMDDLNAKLETNRAYAGNEKYAKQMNDRVSRMATFWRKRKRQCMEFLMLMEDSTEGTISVKKCLSGDGQICIDSDESAIKGAVAYAKKRKTAVLVGRGGLKGRARSETTAALPPDPGFVGVKLNSSGIPERVYSNED